MAQTRISESFFVVPAGSSLFNVKTAVATAVGFDGSALPGGSPFPDGTSFHRILLASDQDIRFRRQLATRGPMILFSGQHFSSEIESLENMFIDNPGASDANVYLWMEIVA